MAHESKVEHLLVDLDGTLLGNRNLAVSIDFTRKALSTLSKQAGLKKAASTLLAINREFRNVASEMTPETTNDNRVVELFSKRMGTSLEEARRILKEGVGLIFPGLQRHFFPIPGAREFLDWAKDHYKLTLATNPVWPVEIIELRLRWAGIDPAMFDFITDIRKMHSCKPNREYYEEILEYQKIKPEQCMLIGNELKMDLPATRAGIKVFIVGDYKRVSHLKHPQGTAPAWRGSFPSLKKMLLAGEI